MGVKVRAGMEERVIGVGLGGAGGEVGNTPVGPGGGGGGLVGEAEAEEKFEGDD